MTARQLSGWFPVRLCQKQDRPTVEWCHLGGERFTDPFFGETVERCLRWPFNQLFRQQTPADVLGEWQELRPGVPPAGFIFHMSRCGSTLVSQMLAALPGSVVLSEASPIDDVLRLPGATDEQRVAWLRGMVSALGQRWDGGETRLFIKFDSWHTLDLPLIDRAFPGVPWVFAYRDPVEVLVSQLKHRGIHTVPTLVACELFGLPLADAVRMPPEEYCARVVATVCRAAFEHHRAGGGRLINYRQLPEVVWSSLAGYFGIALGDEDRERMRHVAQYDAKSPGFQFTADSEAKQREATPLVRAMADTWVRPVYEQLEAARQAGPAG